MCGMVQAFLLWNNRIKWASRLLADGTDASLASLRALFCGLIKLSPELYWTKAEKPQPLTKLS